VKYICPWNDICRDQVALGKEGLKHDAAKALSDKNIAQNPAVAESEM